MLGFFIDVVGDRIKAKRGGSWIHSWIHSFQACIRNSCVQVCQLGTVLSSQNSPLWTWLYWGLIISYLDPKAPTKAVFAQIIVYKGGIWVRETLPFCYYISVISGFPSGIVEKNPPANAGDVSSILGSVRSPGKGNGNPLQFSCLGNPMNRGGWHMGSSKTRDRTCVSCNGPWFFPSETPGKTYSF